MHVDCECKPSTDESELIWHRPNSSIVGSSRSRALMGLGQTRALSARYNGMRLWCHNVSRQLVSRPLSAALVCALFVVTILVYNDMVEVDSAIRTIVTTNPVSSANNSGKRGSYTSSPVESNNNGNTSKSHKMVNRKKTSDIEGYSKPVQTKISNGTPENGRPGTNQISTQSSVATTPGPGTVGRLYLPGFRSVEQNCTRDQGESLLLVVLVTTAPGHRRHRKAIRSTWGSVALRRDVVLRFIVGVAPPQDQQGIDEEQRIFGDIVQGNFVDSYTNLTLKSVSIMEWLNTYCSRARLILKTDDDMFINTENLLSFAGKHVDAKRTVYGRIASKWKPVRNTKSKYYISLRDFARATLPNFATGPAYVLTGDLVREMYTTALTQPYLKLEDVFFTGILAELLKIRLVHVKEFINDRIRASVCRYKKNISIHMISYSEQFDIWKQVLDDGTQC